MEDLSLSSSSLYDLEYRAVEEDDAWYSVRVDLDAQAETLTVRYLCYPNGFLSIFSAKTFHTDAQVDQFVRRFRPVSRQLQERQCPQLKIGTTVCAAHTSPDDSELVFYDAFIEAVDHQPHLFSDDGEEECHCTFLLFWQHGPIRGTVTSATIASICIVVEPPLSSSSSDVIDSRICDFATLAKENVTSSMPISQSSRIQNNSCRSIQELESSPNKLQEMWTGVLSESLTWKCEDSGRMMGNYDQCKSQDEDFGPQLINTDGSAKSVGGRHFILINNIEKDLTPSSIEQFIYDQTSILPQAFVFPRLLSDPFARGAIVVDCQKKAQTIYEFLENPNHLIVSSRGSRPWVVIEKAPLLRSSAFGSLIPVTDLMQDGDTTSNKLATGKEVEIVHSGTESYERAKQLKDLFLEFTHHQIQVCKTLVLEEDMIRRPF